jgi:transposase-like protein
MSKRFPLEVRERAVKMVLSHLDEYPSVYGAAKVIAPSVGVGHETLRRWVVLAQEADLPGGEAEAAREESKRVRELERRVRDLTEANEILKAASVFFAGELDPRRRSR